MKGRLLQWTWDLALLVLLLAGVSFLSLSLGPSGISPAEVLRLIFRDGMEGSAATILFDIRLPRVVLGFAVGGGLSVAGVVLQGMFRNPLVEPYTLGISGGAALGVALSTVLGFTGLVGVYSLPVAGFSGAFGVILFLYFMSSHRGILSMQGLLLTGVMISFIASSTVLLIMSVARVEELHGILFWIIGSLGETDWFLVKLALIVAVACLVVSYLFCFDLNAMSLGEEDAHHLGVDVEKTKRRLFVLASVLTGVCVSLTGAIGFVGLVVPHFVRMLVGTDHRILLVSSFLSGAIFLIFCDAIAKTVALPLELPVGVVTGILGGGLFVYVLARRGYVRGKR